jgi:Rer1 family
MSVPGTGPASRPSAHTAPMSSSSMSSSAMAPAAMTNAPMQATMNSMSSSMQPQPQPQQQSSAYVSASPASQPQVLAAASSGPVSYASSGAVSYGNTSSAPNVGVSAAMTNPAASNPNMGAAPVGAAPAGGLGSTSTADQMGPSFLPRLKRGLQRQFQTYLDRSVPHTTGRWIVFALLLILYGFRVFMLQGFYIVTYGLGIYLLNHLIGFLSPLDEDPSLPTAGGDDDGEFRPFLRRLPEFVFWKKCCSAVCISFVMTFFSMFDIPVFWPILLVYFIVLFVLTMKRQIQHMIQHKYLPFNIGKKKYSKTASAPADATSASKAK